MNCNGSGMMLLHPTGKPGWLGSKGECPVCHRKDLAVTLAGRSWKHKRPADLKEDALRLTLTQRVEDLEEAAKNTVDIQTLTAMFAAHNKNKIEPLQEQVEIYTSTYSPSDNAIDQAERRVRQWAWMKLRPIAENVRKIDNWQKQPWWKRWFSQG